MKRSLIILLALLVAAVGGAGYAAADVNTARDQIEITENIMFGERAAAAGLTVTARNTFDHRLFWDTTYVMEEDEAKAETAFDFSAMRENEVWTWVEDGVLLESYYVFGFEPNSEESYFGLQKAYQELYDTLEPGEEATKVINVRDYMEYYPVQVELNLPGATGMYLDAMDGAMMKAEKADLDPGTAIYAAYVLQQYFKIPILEDEKVEIQVGKSAVSQSYTIGGGAAAETMAIGNANIEDSYSFSTVSAVTDSVCYFTFNTHSNEGQIVDTSELADGYGIYALPYFPAEKFNEGYKIEEFSNVYPLDPAIKVIDLSLSPDGTELLLHAVEDGEYVITVIDIATMETLQKLSVCDWPEDGYGWWLYEYDDFFAVAVPQDHVAVIRRNVDREYVIELLVPVDHDEEDEYQIYLNYNETMAFDGEKLAVSRTMGGGSCTDFFVAIYDTSGLIYYGEYYNSLSAENDMAHAYAGSNWQYVYYDSNILGCEAMYNEPIQLEWN